MSRTFDTESISEKTLISIPVSIAISTLSLAIYGTILYNRVCVKIDQSMTVTQAQEWIDDAREKNPQIYWPRLPEKHSPALTAREEGPWP